MRGIAVNFEPWQGARVAAISAAISERERNAAKAQKARNPMGGGYFSRLRRWLGSQSPLWGFSCLTVLDSAEIALRALLRIYEMASRVMVGDLRFVRRMVECRFSYEFHY